MDLLQAYLPYLSHFLPPSVFTTIIKILTTGFSILKTAQTHLSPLLIRVTTQPDVASLLALVVLLFVSLKILDMAYRAVMFWVRLVFRLVLWGTLAAMALWIWNRGADGFVQDVQNLGSHWWGEYERFKDEAKDWQSFQEQEVRKQAGRKQGAAYGQQGRQW
ncbi:unnamed protein product [Periconia digitata]|uniref:Nuclear pore assembly and biogenesis-domain-containing protein n=1 Tax=Periconia digitata TaxID=1303443 RepID=A0A9W4XDK5_9PLEO|nr:unnamed protein product [Periconia digitata]